MRPDGMNTVSSADAKNQLDFSFFKVSAGYGRSRSSSLGVSIRCRPSHFLIGCRARLPGERHRAWGLGPGGVSFNRCVCPWIVHGSYVGYHSAHRNVRLKAKYEVLRYSRIPLKYNKALV
jgi:hypothetical protein